MLEVLAVIFAILRVVILGTLTTVIYVIDLSTRHTSFEKMLAKCRSCLYFSRGQCLKFGKGFYSALECRQNENKCGSLARWYLERTGSKKNNEDNVSGSGANGDRR